MGKFPIQTTVEGYISYIFFAAVIVFLPRGELRRDYVLSTTKPPLQALEQFYIYILCSITWSCSLSVPRGSWRSRLFVPTLLPENKQTLKKNWL